MWFKFTVEYAAFLSDMMSFWTNVMIHRWFVQLPFACDNLCQIVKFLFKTHYIAFVKSLFAFDDYCFLW